MRSKTNVVKGEIMESEGINFLSGEYFFLCNFYLSQIVGEDELVYSTVEHYFQAAKTLILLEKNAIRLASTPSKAKRLGRQCGLRKDWEEVKVDVMRKALKLKFQDEQLWAKLQATGSRPIVESNVWHDNVWGDCTCYRFCKDIPGQNLLGKLLMELRDGGR